MQIQRLGNVLSHVSEVLTSVLNEQGDIGEISYLSIHFHFLRATEKQGQEFQTSGPPASHSTSSFSLAWTPTSEGFDYFSYALCLAVRVEQVGSAHGVIVLICKWLITSVCSSCWRSMELIPCSVLVDLFQKNKKIKETKAVLKLSSISKMLAGQAWGLDLDPNNPCKKSSMCWRVDSVVKNTCCSSRGPRFNSEHLCGHSQPLIIPVPKNLIPSSDFCGHQTYTWYTDHASWTYTIKLKILFFKVRHGGAC